MSHRMRATVIAFSLLVVGYVVVGSVLGRTASEGAYKQLAVFSEVFSRVQHDYVEEPDLDLVTVGALHGLVSELDPYSSYLSPHEYERYQQQKQEQGNVGLVLSKRQGWVSVVTVLPDSPAARAELHTGDILESIAGFSTREMSIEQARILLNGEPGTAVEVALVHPPNIEPQMLELLRVRLSPPPILARRLEAGIGYIKIAGFHEETAEQVASALHNFQQRGIDKLVLDLRDAATGTVDEAVATAALFLDGGLITYSEGQQTARQQWTADPAEQVWRGPLAVLMNLGTAGPAEILAAAVQDHGRGELLGQHSYGIGGVQKLIPLEDGSALILTVAKYYTATGRVLPGQGVAPTIPVEPPEGQALRPLPHALPPPGDPVLQRALKVLRQAERVETAA
ncbi:MAG: S41 family peptidase [Terriglobia bacterium]